MTSAAERPVVGLPRVPQVVLVRGGVSRALDSAQPLTVVRAARGFGKTAVLVSWLKNHADGPRTVFHTLDERANTEDGFWAGLARSLNDAGLLDAVTEQDPRRDVLRGLGAYPGRLRLVLDNFHEAGRTAGAHVIDHDLIELLRRNEDFHLMVAGRTQRALESMGSLSVDAALIGPHDLGFDAAQVRDLAAAYGAPVSWAQARQLADALGGWPAAISTLVRHPAADGTLDENVIADYVGAVLADLSGESERRFLLSTAVPEFFDIDLVRAIAGSSDAEVSAQHARSFGQLRGAGLFHGHPDVDSTQYRYPPAIRRALLRLVRETEPRLERDVHRLLVARAAAQQAPMDTLVHAIHAAEWDSALDIIERQWLQLVTAAGPDLAQAVRLIPQEYAVRDARLRVARDHLAAVSGNGHGHARWRVRGILETTVEIADGAVGRGEPADLDAVALLQWGAASLMNGSHDAAVYAFSQAREVALRHGGAAAHMGASGLALAYALVGEPDLARSWLDDATLRAHMDAGDQTGSAEITVVTARIAAALAAVDAGEPDAFRSVDEVITPRNRADLWVLAEFTRGRHAAFGDDPEEVLRQANSIQAALRHTATGTLAETVLRSVLVELLLASRAVQSAAEVADQMNPEPIGWTARAKVELVRENHAAAIGWARRAVGSAETSRRSTLECWVVLASALHASGDDAGSQEAFREAVELARATGQRRPFHLMSRYVFDALCAGVPTGRSLWPASEPAGLGVAAASAPELPTFTTRELQVLRALERHAGPVGIGRALNLSTNTVKTHLRSIYRKLSVTSRNEALEAIQHAKPTAPGEQWGPHGAGTDAGTR